MSKDWKKIVLVATVTVSSLLISACGKDKQKASGNQLSPFNGVWMDSAALTDFSTWEASSTNPFHPAEMYRYCQKVYRSPQIHGLNNRLSNGAQEFRAWRIDVNGEVFLLDPNVQPSAEFVKNYYLGRVASDGNFNLSEHSGANQPMVQQKASNSLDAAKKAWALNKPTLAVGNADPVNGPIPRGMAYFEFVSENSFKVLRPDLRDTPSVTRVDQETAYDYIETIRQCNEWRGQGSRHLRFDSGDYFFNR